MTTTTKTLAQRLADVDDDPERPHLTAEAQTAAIMDAMLAQLVRNSRSGQGKGLRESGFTETADELGL